MTLEPSIARGAVERIVCLPPDVGDEGRLAHELDLRDAGRDIVLDLGLLQRVEPLLVVRIAAWMRIQAAHERQVKVLAPKRPQVAGALAAAGLEEMIDAELPSSSAEECRENGVLLSLSRLGGEGVLTDLAVRFRDVFARTFDIGPKAGRGAMEQALFELGDNAATHGASDYGAYVAAQRCASGRCMLAVGDTGVGIPAHMRRSHGADASDGAAIEHAMRMRTTGTPDLDRGVGYGGIIREMTKVEVPEARLRIWSGGARHSFVVCRGAVREQRTEESVSPTVGTWVSFEVHLGAEGARFEFRR